MLRKSIVEDMKIFLGPDVFMTIRGCQGLYYNTVIATVHARYEQISFKKKKQRRGN
jgi:hypothetical protein